MKNYKQITSTGFVIGLALLLFNDFYLKGELHNWFTGKLSDFAGLFIFPIFWSILFPKFRDQIFLGTALLFIFWKTPLSQPLINAINQFSPFLFSRVVDYTDYWALLILPFTYIYLNSEKKSYIRINPVYIGLLACFAFMATTIRTNVEQNKVYHFNYSKQILRDRVSSNKNIIEISENKRKIDISKDSLTFKIRDHFYSHYYVDVILSGDRSKSTLTLSGFTHRNPRNEITLLVWRDDKKLLTQSFEKKVVSKLTTNREEFDNSINISEVYLGISYQVHLILLAIAIPLFFVLRRYIKTFFETLLATFFITPVVYFPIFIIIKMLDLMGII